MLGWAASARSSTARHRTHRAARLHRHGLLLARSTRGGVSKGQNGRASRSRRRRRSARGWRAPREDGLRVRHRDRTASAAFQSSQRALRVHAASGFVLWRRQIMTDSTFNAERLRLEAQHEGKENWRLWGPYLSERAWG